MEPSYIQIPILQSDWLLAKSIGEKRLHAGKGSKGWGNRTIDQESIGVIGEIIVCKYFNQKPEFVFGKSDYCDLVINQKTVDVKTSLMKPWWKIEQLHLLAHKVSHKTDLYIRVLISADKKVAILSGWIERENLEKYAFTDIYNGHELFKLPMKYLKNIQDLTNQ